jgi:hypothetical protein
MNKRQKLKLFKPDRFLLDTQQDEVLHARIFSIMGALARKGDPMNNTHTLRDHFPGVALPDQNVFPLDDWNIADDTKTLVPDVPNDATNTDIIAGMKTGLKRIGLEDVYSVFGDVQL